MYRGEDWYVHRMSNLWMGIPDDTDVVVITAASVGNHLGQIDEQVHPLAQVNLDAFVLQGGTLVVSLADNDPYAGYEVPGAFGTPALTLPADCSGAMFDGGAFGADLIAGTADDHSLLLGADGVPETDDDLRLADVQMESGCYAAHGNLANGIVLPPNATVLMSAVFEGGARAPVLAEYSYGEGQVVLTTLTMEYQPEDTVESADSRFLRNLFDYALGFGEGQDEMIPGPGENQRGDIGQQ